MNAKNNSLCGLVFAFLIILALPMDSLAHEVIQPPESTSLKHASSAFLVRITKSEAIESGGITCGSRYYATIQKAIKGDPKLREIDFGFLMGLEIGRTYKVYLKQVQNRPELIDFLKYRYIGINEAEQFVTSCEQVWPRYYFFRADKQSKNQN